MRTAFAATATSLATWLHVRAVKMRETSKPGRVYLLRVFVDVAADAATIETVYRASKIEKFWRER